MSVADAWYTPVEGANGLSGRVGIRKVTEEEARGFIEVFNAKQNILRINYLGVLEIDGKEDERKKEGRIIKSMSDEFRKYKYERLISLLKKRLS